MFKQEELFPTAVISQPTHTRIKLRPYQQACLEANWKAWSSGTRRILDVLPTGSGKSLVFSQIPTFPMHRATLLLAHRNELIEQAADHLKYWNPHLNIGIEKAEYRANVSDEIVVASVQTLGRMDTGRINKFPPNHFSHIIIDECHHSTSKQYVNILKYFGCGSAHGPYLLGVTATPFRGDGIPLSNLFDTVAFGRTITDLIEEGERDSTHGPYLCRLVGKQIRTDVDLTNLHIRMGDFAEDELAEVCNVDGRNSKIISGIEDHAADRKSILIFCVDKDHTRTLTEQLQKRGHNAEYVLAETPALDRKRIIKDFKSGNLRILVNCGCLTEGFDAPNADCAVLARPTRSPLLYFQIIGRVCRVYPGKVNALVLDVVDNVGHQHIQTIGDAFGVRGCDFLKEDVYAKSQVIKKASELGINIEVTDTIDKIEQKVETVEKVIKGTVYVETKAQMVDVFSAADSAQEVINDSEFPWIRVNQERYVLPMMDGKIVKLERDVMGKWSVYNGGIGLWKETKTGDAPLKWADSCVKKFYQKYDWQAKSIKAKWRQKSASTKQREVLKRLGIHTQPSQMTKGAASTLIDYLMWFRKSLHGQASKV